MNSTRESGMRVAVLILIAIVHSAAVGDGAMAANDSGRCTTAGSVRLCTDVTFPGEGQICLVTLQDSGIPVSGAKITTTFRPNSEVAVTEVLGITDGFGRFAWTPNEAGIATLTAEAEGLDPVDLTVSVKFQRPSALGITILILAGMILFGGNGYAFAKTFGRR